MKSKQNKKTQKGRFAGDRQNPIVPSLQAAPETHPEARAANQWLTGEGEMTRRVREFDWSKTALGATSLWPASLRAATSICLNSRFPMFIAWGAHRAMLYNDAYIAVLAGKHPGALGRPAQEVWEEIWHILGPHWAHVFDKGEATWAEDLLLLMNRSGYDEETYFTFSYSPIRDETGSVGGMFCACQETTDKVVGERRLRTLGELAAQATLAKSAREACTTATKTLSDNSFDLPFALLYLSDGSRDRASLAGAAGLVGDGPASPSCVALDGEDSDGWPLGQVLREGAARCIENLPDRFGSLPSGPWTQPTSRALLLPIQLAAHELPAGVLIAGISPVRPLDEGYRTFLEVAAGQIASAIANTRAYEQERQKAEALAELDRAKTAFFSNVSHEFRTPLTLMLGPVEDLLGRSHTDLSPAAKGQLEVVNRNGLRLLRLVNTLLDFSRLEAGRVQAVFEPTDLAAFTTELASVFRAATERAGLGLRVDCPKLPEAAYVDRDMWEKIVLNLLSNAFKFTFEGEIEVKLRVMSDESGEEFPLTTRHSQFAVLTVRDTGVGIPAEEMPRLFERFHRVQNMRSRTHEGSGIGLALVQELVKLHGGSIRAESRLGKGASFIVTIPLGAKHLPADRLGGSRSLASTAVGAAPFVEEALRWLPEAAPVEEATLPPSHHELMPVPCPPGARDDGDGRPRIVVADDNADMRHYLARMLTERYSVEEVPDGQAALAAARERRPDLILSDVMMPNLDGFGLVRELRSDSGLKTIPIILLSARAGEESRVEGLQEGADDYLVKPFSARELMARVAAHLEMARVRKEAGEKIQQSEEQLRTTLESIGDGFFSLDGDWRFIYVNAPAERILGIQREAVLGKSHREVFPLMLGTELEQRYRLAAGGQAQDWENFYEPWGRWFHNRCFPREGGGMSVYFQDITERKQEEAALRESRAKLKAAFASMTDAIFIADAEGRLIDFNEGFVRYHRFKDREECSKTIADCPRYLDAYFQDGTPAPLEMWAMARALRGETESDVEYILRRKETGETWWGSYNFAPIKDEGGKIVGAVVAGREITDRKRAEEALRESEEKFRRIVETANEGILLASTDGKITFANERMGQIVGYTVEELVGMTGAELVADPEELARAQDLAKKREAGVRSDYEIRMRRKDAGEVWLLASGSPVYDDTGRHVGNLGMYFNITQRKRAEEALRESEERFRSLFEHSPDAVFLTTPDTGQVHNANPAACGMFGMTVQEFGAVGRGIIAPEDSRLASALEERKQTGRARTELTCVRKNGQRFPAEVTSVIVPGDPQRSFVIVRDITARKQAEQELRRALAEAEEGRRILQAMMEHIPMGITIADAPDVRIRMVSRYGRELTGRPKEHIEGIAVEQHTERWGLFRADGVTPTTNEELPLTRATQKGELVKEELFILAQPGGTKVPILCTAAPIRDAQGHIIGGVIGWQDITERKRTEDALRQAVAELERSNKELEQFAYISAHDLQEPLRQVRAFVQMLKDRHADKFDGKAAEYFGYVYDGAARMSELVQGLLEYSRVGSREARHEATASQQALDTALSNLQASIAETHASITHDELPSVVAEPTQLTQLFQNLIGNALKFCRDGVPPEIHVGARLVRADEGSGFRVQETGSQKSDVESDASSFSASPRPRISESLPFWLFSVKDNGIGIAPEFHEKIFVIFQRLHTREKYAGTGIGLAICKKIVEQHGGKIWIESKVEQGSTFYFSLPGEGMNDG